MGAYLPGAFNDNLPARRWRVERVIERLMTILDDMESDPDLELGADDEPILGWLEWGGHGWSRHQEAASDDREEDVGDEG